MKDSYDFIVVGAGPAGCVVARRLADAQSKPTVLLVEAGSDNKDVVSYRGTDMRYALAFTEPKVNWSYLSQPQEHLHNRVISQARGKGLGGSSAINFSHWSLGSQDDYNEWAKMVEDPAWKWSAVQKRLAMIENYDQYVSEEHKQYLDPSARSTEGKLNLSYAREWNPMIEIPTMAATKQMGWIINRDINSGDPIGVGLPPATWYHGQRVTAAEAYLTNKPSNLTIVPDTAVARVLFDQQRATGIETISGIAYYAKHEVVLSAGVLNTPQLLMLSGIGPKQELLKHDIAIVKELPGVGQHLIDHILAPMTHVLKPEAAKDIPAISALSAADPQYQVGGQVPTGFLKSEALLQSAEFQDLDQDVQTFLKRETVPHFEFATFPQLLNPGTYTPQPTDRFRSLVTFLMNLQSTGTVTLASSNPKDDPIIDPNYFSHPFDRRLAIEAMRETLKLQSTPAMQEHISKIVCAPTNDDDDTLIEYWRAHAGSVWHMSGTVKMGPFSTDDPLVCATPDFRIRGIRGLRVADNSVAPLMASGHAAAPAYLIGETCAEKLIGEYTLDKCT